MGVEKQKAGAIAAALDAAPVIDFLTAKIGSGGEADNEELARLERSDTGNAERLIARFGKHLMFVKDMGWFAWVGTHWSFEEGLRMARMMAQRTARLIHDEAVAAKKAGRRRGARDPDTQEFKFLEDEAVFEERIKTLEAWAISSANSAKLKNMLNEAQPHLTVTVDALDADPYLVNTRNCTLRICEQSGAIHAEPHDPADRITKCLACAYDPGADAPTFMEFLEKILPDPEVQDFMQTWLGYSLMGITHFQCLVLALGHGANGKTTLFDLVRALAGGYGKAVRFSSLLHNERGGGGAGPSPDLARLVGARMVAAEEPDLGVTFSEGLIKELTGGAPLTVRRLHQDFFEFVPEFKLSLSVNNRPNIRGQDDGIWRRINVVPFEVTIPKEDRDGKLPEKLRAEMPGVLNWLVDGMTRVVREGLTPPPAVVAAVDKYKADMNPLSVFVEDCLTIYEGQQHDNSLMKITAADMYEGYKTWCKKNSDREPVNHTVFGLRMGERKDMFKARKGGLIYYFGVGWKADFNPKDAPIEPI